jgi:hypothetical protein
LPREAPIVDGRLFTSSQHYLQTLNAAQAHEKSLGS